MPEPAVPRDDHLMAEIDRAFANGDYAVRYQPIVSLDQARSVAGAEALFRWSGAKPRSMSPASAVARLDPFRLTSFVLADALARRAVWQKRFTLVPSVWVNLTDADLIDTGLARRVAAAAWSCGADPEGLVLEIPETAHDRLVTVRAMSALRDLGVRIAVDDYGSGLAGVERLMKVLPDVVKIAGSMLDQALAGDEQILEDSWGTVALAHELGVQVVAEGVETPAHLEAAVELSVDYVQGYFLAEPAVDVEAGTLTESESMNSDRGS